MSWEFFDLPEHVCVLWHTWVTCLSLLQVLQDTLTNLHAAGVENPFYQPCHTHVLNPKSITMEELYGGINKLTLEWSDGLMAMTVRSCVQVGRKWGGVSLTLLWGGEEIRCILTMCTGMWKWEGLRLLKEKVGSTQESQTMCGQSQAGTRGVCNGV